MNALREHAFEAEEVMAYLDGELEPQRAAALAAHLEHCGECQAISRDFRQLSERMLDFSVEPAPQRIGETVRAAHAEWKPETAKKPARLRFVQDWRKIFSTPYGFAVSAAMIVVAVMIVIAFGRPNVVTGPRLTASDKSDLRTRELRSLTTLVGNQVPATGQQTTAASDSSANDRIAQDEATQEAAPPGPPPPPASPNVFSRLENYAAEFALPKAQSTPAVPTVPMIARTAAITIVPSNYDEASAALEGLATSRGGYVQTLTTQAPSDSSRQLSETLRIPQQQLAEFMADVRKLGRVEQESQSNVEVTAEYVDLDARVKNARATEQRLTTMLETRTGRLEDVLDVERELDRVRGDIESMQGQENLLLHRVNYATVDVQLEEQYQARLGTGTSTGTQLWNAIVEGYGNLRDGSIGLLVFLFSDGPAILFWSLIALVPLWFVWRRMRRPAQRAAE